MNNAENSEKMIDSNELKRGFQQIIKDGICSQIMVTLTGGIFLTGLALELGASNFVVGILAAIPPVMQLVQIPSIYLVERLRTRKPMVAYAAGISRIFLLIMALLPFFFSGKEVLWAFLGTLLLHAGWASVSGTGWNSWMRDLIPQDILGSFFSRRLMISTLLGLILSFAAGIYIDIWKRVFPDNIIDGYMLLFIVGGIVGLIGVYFITTIPEPLMQKSKEKLHIVHLFLNPLRDLNYRNLIFFLSSWNFAVNLAAPFFTVYMLKELELDMAYVIGFTLISQIMNIVCFGIWGKFSDIFSNKSVLRVCGPLFMVCVLAWTFTTLPDRYVLTIPLLVLIHIFTGISTAGVQLSTANIAMKLAPRGEATSYLAANTVFNSLAAGIAPVIGGLCADGFEGHELSWTFAWTHPSGSLTFQTFNLHGWDFFFFFAFLLGIFSIHRLSRVKEEGEVTEKIILREIFAEVRRQLRSVSSVGGLQQMVYFPFMLLVKAGKKLNIKSYADEEQIKQGGPYDA